jgi:hypothetical protein
MSIYRELVDEFRIDFSGRSRVIDAFVPPLVFLVVNRFSDLRTALIGALGIAILIFALRVFGKQSLVFDLGDIGGVLLVVVITFLLGREESFFLPGIITGFVALIISVVSLIARRPMIAWTSDFARC